MTMGSREPAVVAPNAANVTAMMSASMVKRTYDPGCWRGRHERASKTTISTVTALAAKRCATRATCTSPDAAATVITDDVA